MSVVDYGKDWEYASTRIRNTLVRYGVNPFYVLNVKRKPKGSGGVAFGINTYTKEEKKILLEDLNLTPVPLGYVNFTQGVILAQRTPSRYWKQGLDRTNLRHSFNIAIDSIPLAKTILGLYPTHFEVFEEVVNGEVVERAFSRDFSFSFVEEENKEMKVNLKYREKLVGKVSCNNGGKNVNFFLNEKFSFLGEVLENSIHA